MKNLTIKSEIYKYDSFREFAKDFKLGRSDLILTNEYIYKPYSKGLNLNCTLIFQEDYGTGEPSDRMIDSILKDIKDTDCKRIIGIGGGTIIDIAKILAIKDISKTEDLQKEGTPIIRDKSLVIVPTTCGTGSEVTNLSIINMIDLGTKIGIAKDVLYPDQAVLIPQLLSNLPYKVFIFSSIDAFIHAAESYVSPGSNEYTELFSGEAMRLILKGYKKLTTGGKDCRHGIIYDFMMAANFAGIAFANTGVGAVHALSYPLGSKYHIPHGESNYQFFTGVFKTYKRIKPGGKIEKLNRLLADSSDYGENIYSALDNMFESLLKIKRLKEYGVTEEDIEAFADSVLTNQKRLLKNNYVSLSKDDIRNIYKSRF